MKQWLAQLPKAELHVHLDGSLRWETVTELAEQLPANRRFPDGFDLRAEVIPPKRATLEEYLRSFDAVLPLLQTPAALERAAFELGVDAARDGLIYIEVRFAPLLHTELGMKPREVVQSVLRGLEQAEQETTIRTGLLLTGLKQEPTERSMEVAQLTAQFRNRGVVGFDLAGPEKLYPPLLHRRVIEFARAAGVHVTLHAGEGCCPEQVREAVDLGAERIGHGVFLCRDPETQKRVAEQRIPLEVCPTSNLQIADFIDSYTDHPMAGYHEAGIPITLNTDNRLMSQIDLTHEFVAIAEAFSYDRATMAQFAANGIDAAFVDDDTRQKLKAQLADYLVSTDVQLPSGYEATSNLP